MDKLEDVVEFENQRAAYVEDQRQILNGYNRLMDMLGAMDNVTCEEEVQCNRDKIAIAEVYQDDFDVLGKLTIGIA